MEDFFKAMIAKTDWMKTLTGVTVLFVFTFQAYFLGFHEIPKGNEPVFHILFGIIDTAMVGLIQYYFGSSKGSQDKQRTIDKMNDEKNNS
jgi:hypothetical protein